MCSRQLRVFIFALPYLLAWSAACGSDTQLAITSVNSGVTPTDIAPFTVTVQAQDAGGAPASVGANTTVALTLNNGNGNLYGSLLATIPAGQSSVVFNNILYNLAESGVVVTAFTTIGDKLGLANSALFAVAPGPASALFANAPTGTAFATGPFSLNIRSIDVANNPAPVAADTAVTVSLLSGSGRLGGALSGMIPAGHSAITLPITYSKPEANVLIQVTRTSGDALNSATTFFNVADTPIKLFVLAPFGATTSAPFSIQVNAVDAAGNSAPVVSDTFVTLTKAAGFGTLGGTLSGVIPAGSTSLVLNALTYSMADSIKLTATATGGDTLTAFTTSAIPIGNPPAPPVSLQVTVFGPITAGAPFDVRVTAQDGTGQAAAVQANTNISVTLTTGAGTLSGVLTGTIGQGQNSIDLSAVAYSQPESGVVLSATAVSGDALGTANSAPFNVLGPPTTLSAQVLNFPSAGAPCDVEIDAVDANGLRTNVLADTLVSVSATPAAGTGVFGGVLTGTIFAGANTVDLFAVTYSKQESNVALTVSAAGLTPAASTPFNVGGAAAQLSVSAPVPATPTAGEPFSIIVTALTSGHAPAIVGANTTVTLTLASGGGALSGILSGTIPTGNSSTMIAGVLYSQADNSVAVSAAAAGLGSAQSAAFRVNAAPLPGPPARIDVWSGNSQTAPIGTAVANPPTVFVRDANSFPVTGATVTFTVASGGGTVLGASAVTDANGLASVGAWTLGALSGKNTLTASSNGLNVTFTATATGGPPQLQLISGPAAAPTSAGVGQTVQFSAAANLTDAVFSWTFGDGAADTSGNPSPTHAYAAAGRYTATVTASDALQSVQGTIFVNVIAPTVGTGNDSDGDGFSDSYEIAAGTNPLDPTSFPFSLDGVVPVPLNVSTLSVRLNFARKNGDALTFSGILPVAASKTLTGTELGLVLGDFVTVFKLEATGKAKNKSGQVAVTSKIQKKKLPAILSTFKIQVSKENLAAALAAFGLTNANAKNQPVTISGMLVFATTISPINAKLHYHAVKNRTGMAK